jgi:hypothetical protein
VNIFSYLSTKEAAASQSGGDICGHLLQEV